MSTHRIEAWLFPTWFGLIGSRFVMKSSIYILLVVNALCLDSSLLEAASVADQTNAISLSPTVLTALFDEARTNNRM